MQRRTWLKVGVIGGAVLALGGGLALLARPGWEQGRLTPAGRAMFGALADAVLDGLLPAAGPARQAALQAQLARLEATVAGLPPPVQAEIEQLSALLLHPAGRVALAGLSADWAEASVADVQAALQGLRMSRLDTKQQVYHALRELNNGAWFADPGAWPAIGYPGPRTL